MRVIPLLLLGVSVFVTQADAQTKDKPQSKDAAEIRKLVPWAAGMKLGDLDKLATAVTTPKDSDLESKTLTFLLLTLKVNADDAKAKEAFRFLRAVKAVDVAKEITRSVRGAGRFRVALGPVTMIQGHRITDITCVIEGDTAKGFVSFKVPKLYEGKVSYLAKRKDGKWQIKEFAMPAYKIDIARAEKGMWIHK